MHSNGDAPESFDTSITDLMKMASQTNQAVQQIGELVRIANTCLENGLQLTEAGAPYSESVIVDLKSMASWIHVLTQEVEQMSTLSVAVLTRSMGQMVKGFQKSVIKEALEAAENREGV
ncbi:MAG: hypothetical protein IIB16_08995 [Chloroflexi bacterium]|nr:hypothetical protein [Chloroflexota bacterium]